VGAFTGGLFGELQSMSEGFSKVAAHGVVGGMGSAMQGGKFGHGFLSAGVSAQLSPKIQSNVGDAHVRVAIHAAIGGTVSKVTGGKFANGAYSAAFSSALREGVRAARDEEEPQGRALTDDEVTEAESVFGDKIDYSEVRIIDGKYVPFQGDNYVIAPDGNIYWPGECGNLSSCGGVGTAGVFIHEMTHVMQHQHGVNVLGRGLLLQSAKFLSLGLYDPYQFDYDPIRSFSSYNIEQQGDYARGIYFGRYPNRIDY